MINIAVIGFGFMGITHALNIQKNKKFNLRAIITRDVTGIPSKLHQQIGNFPIGEIDTHAILQVPVYKTLRECLRNEKIDAVQISVHTDLHYEMATEAIENGLHVFLEKPITLRLEEGSLLIAFAKQKKVKLMVGHVVRFMPAYRKLKEWIDTKEFGALKFISLTRFSGLPSWGQWKEKQRQFGSSGGALFDLLIHDVDFLNYTLGTPEKIESVSYPGSLSMHDYIIAHWSYKDIKAKIEGGNTFHSTFPFQAGYMVRFENASVMYSSQVPQFIQVCTDEKVSQIYTGAANDGFYNEIDYFADCITNDSEALACTPESSLDTIRLCYSHL
jgi:predicted dehydrogenase